MKTKKSDILTCILFCGFLFAMFALYLLMPPADFSALEKRELAEAPAMNTDNLLSGQYGEEAETWLADHIPGRNFFVGLASYYDLFTGRQYTKDVYPAGNNRLVEAPNPGNEAAVQRNMRAINRFAETLGRPVDLMIIPSAGYVLQNSVEGLHDSYRDDALIADIYARAGENVTCWDMLSVFKEEQSPEELYYRTDHHWTSLGAYRAYSAYMEGKNRIYPEQSEFAVESYDGFRGSTYSRSGLWLIPPESVELWKTDTVFTVTHGESDIAHNGLFYEERLSEPDMYTVYLDGNHSTVRIENPQMAGKGKLLVIRDSYANCLGTFLAHSYETVVLVDLRYYKESISTLLEAEEFTDVLVCYSLNNFLTDTNLLFLK